MRVDGQIARHVGFLVDDRSVLAIDDEVLATAAPLYVLLHKPRGVVTTRMDERGRPTVFDLVPSPVPLHAVGRLDLATTGLLVLTNDTGFSAWVTDPTNGVRRTYLVTVRGRVDEATVGRLVAGIDDAGERLSADAITLRKASGRESHLSVDLSEGKNREVRRLFLAVGHEVVKLKRVAFGGLALGDLAPAAHRTLSPEELLAAFPGAPLREALPRVPH